MLEGIPRNYIRQPQTPGMSSHCSDDPSDYCFENAELIKILNAFYNDSNTLEDPHPDYCKIADIYPRLMLADRRKLQDLLNAWVHPRMSASFGPEDHLRMGAVNFIYHIAPHISTSQETFAFYDIISRIQDFTTIRRLANDAFLRLEEQRILLSARL
ncbi:MAG: hypothetical protein V4494_05555 [Chlamydiota bacterium]